MKHDFFLRRQIKRFSPFIAVSLLLCFDPGSETLAASQPEYVQHVEQTGKKVKGQITDFNGEPLIGVNVSIVGQPDGTISDIDGNYSIDVTNGTKLKFTYIGYKEQVISTGSSSVINVKMLEDSKSLDEVVVVGYGVQKKINLSGSVSAIDGERIAAKPATDVLSSLQGEMPGVMITRSSSQPGSEGSNIRVRGFSSANSTSTLILIDGVEGNINLINPSDIESVSVLKDAASCAIYGARAAAGVVLVTTKSGQEGKPRINYNGYYAFNTPGNMPERLPAWEEQYFIDQSRIAATGTSEMSAEKASWIGNPNFNTRPLSNGRWDYFDAVNWVAEGTKRFTTQQDHSISVSGGSKGLNYMLSGNFYTKNGLLKYGPDDVNRYNLHAKVNSNINQYIDLGFNVQYQSRLISSPSCEADYIFNNLYSSRGRQSIYVPEGDKGSSIYNGDLQQNPIDMMLNGGEDEQLFEAFIGKVNLSVKDLIKGLRINLSASRNAGYYSRTMEKRTLIWTDRFGKAIRQHINNPNSLYKKKNSNYHDLLEATANYTFHLNNEHNFNILLGTSYENYLKDEIGATAISMNSNDFFSFNAYDTSDPSNTSISDNIEPWAMMSYFGRISYNYKERYLFEANMRRDGSSRLAPSKRWRTFPSASAAWRLSEESWFGLDFISNLKLRASWGQLGNGAVLGLYDYLPLINKDSYISESAYYQKSLASEDKTWEVIQSTNIGIDFGFLDNRLSGTFEYYWKYNNDMLAAYQLPHQIGISVPNGNIGRLKTWGWDFNIGWKDRIKDFSYQISFNISDSQNVVLEYDGAKKISAGTVSLLEGYEMNTLWGYKTDGYWSSREEYLQYKKDHPGFQSFNDGKIAGGDTKYLSQGTPDHVLGIGSGTLEDHGDLVNLGSTNGRYYYGVNLAAQWKGFDFSVLFQGVGKRSVLLNADLIAPFPNSNNMPWTIHRDYWTEDNQDAYWPRLYHFSSFNFQPCDKWIQNGAYIRLKNLTLGYTIPLPRKYIERLRVYIAGQDIWEHSSLLSVLDPEVGSNTNRSLYPFFRTWSLGVNISF